MNRGIGFVLILGIILAGFAATYFADRYSVVYFPPSFSRTRWVCQWSDGDRYYENTISDLEAEWYPSHWRSAQEPSLYEASLIPAHSHAGSYRFTWLRTFDAPVIVRVDEGVDGSMRLTAKQLGGTGGYGPGGIQKQVARNLANDERDRLKQVLSGAAVFSLPAVGCDRMTDGARWIVEADEAGQYRYVNRHSPENGPVREVGLAFLGLTGWKFARVY